MLVLSRKSQESIAIGNDIHVRIISIRGNTVRIGIEAPKDVSILRSEICEHSEISESPRVAQVLDLPYLNSAARCDIGECLV